MVESDDLPDQLSDELRELAQRHVESARSWYGLTFDYSPASLHLADVAISTFHPDGASQPATVAAYGAYIGEVVRRQLGGHWVAASPEEPPYLIHVAGTATVHAFDWARKRFQHLNEDRIADSYSMLLETLGNGDSIPQCFGPFGEQRTTENPRRLPNADTEPLSSPENLLPASVLIVFLLVAAADGRVSVREQRALQKELEHPPESAPQLYRTTLRQVQQRRQELTRLLPVSGQAELLLRLSTLRDCLEELHSQQARDFCESLLLMGRSIACAAAGWRGFFRSRVDRQAAGILNAIKFVLQLNAASRDSLPPAPKS